MRSLALVTLVACSSAPVRTVPAPPPTGGETSAPANPVPDPGPPGLRLPGDVAPTLYHLSLRLDALERDRGLGTMAIDADVKKPTWVVWLNATDLRVKDAQLNGLPARVIPGGDDYIGLTLDKELPVGPIKIAVTFMPTIDHEKSRGIYVEKEGSENYLYSFFEPTDARRAFPCFDEPSYKVPWQLTFYVKQDHVALANAPVVKETPEKDGLKKVELAVSKPMPSYLVAFVVGPFDVIDGGTAGRVKTPIRFVLPKGRSGELGYAKEITPKVVTALESYFGMDYPFGKLDVAVVPRYWGTMEHPGIVAMGQPLTLIRPDQATRERRENYTNILAHELSHYWFGDYVTMKWWDDTWLNEALGEWMDLVITDAAEPTWKIMLDRVPRGTSAMTFDEALSTKAIRQPVTTKQAIQSSFDGAITYLKGSTVIYMFEQYVGAEKWRDFIRSYMAAHAWGNAGADDLFVAVGKQFGADVEKGMRSFIEQPGVPRISADISCTGKPKLVLHQTRSLPAGVTDPQPKLWTVPVCVRYGDAKSAHRACTMLGAADGELALEGGCPTWTVLGADGAAYYRTSVDLKNATALLTAASAVAKVAKPSTAERLQLVANLRASVERGETGIDQVLALAPVIARDPEDKVARTSLTASDVKTGGLDDALYAKYTKWFVATYKPLAAKLGWKRLAKDSDDRQRLRASVVTSVAYHDAAMQKEAVKLAKAWLADRKAVDDDLADGVLAAAARNGDAALFDAILAAAKQPRDRGEQQRLLGALGGFTDPALVDRALGFLLATEFDLRDSLSIGNSILYRRETRAKAVAFLEAHLDEILKRMREDEASWLLSAIAEAACDAPTVTRLETLVMPRAKQVAGAEASATRGFEISRQCIAATQRQVPALTTYLK